MKKFIAIGGALMTIAALMLGLIDATLGVWQYSDEIFGTAYLNAFGQLTLFNGNVENIEDNIIMIIITTAILVGAVVILIGGFTDKGGLALLGSLVIIAGLAYFFYSLPNFQEIQNYLWFTDKNVFIGSEVVLTVDVAWRLGNGFFVLIVGFVVSLIGSLLKDSK
jgi:hypothetical protein